MNECIVVMPMQYYNHAVREVLPKFTFLCLHEINEIALYVSLYAQTDMLVPKI